MQHITCSSSVYPHWFCRFWNLPISYSSIQTEQGDLIYHFTMSSDKDNILFLYYIVRRLETRFVNWKEVAVRCGTPTAMLLECRYPRLQIQILKFTPRNSSPTGNHSRIFLL